MADGITEQMSEVENMLVTLEDVCEQQDFKVNQLAHQRQLAQYTQAKHMDIEKAKGLGNICVQCYAIN